MTKSFTTSENTYNRTVSLLIIFAVIVTVVFFTILSKNYQRKTKASTGEFATLQFVPASVVAPPQQDVPVAIKLGQVSGPLSIQGYRILGSFDRTKIRITNVTYTLGRVTTGLGDSTDLTQANATGRLVLQGEIFNSASVVVNQDTAVATIHLTVIDQNFTTSNFTFMGNLVALEQLYRLDLVPVNSSTLSVSNTSFTGTPVTTISPSVSVSPTATPTPSGNTTLNMDLRFQGITKDLTPAATMAVKVKLVSVATNESYSQVVTFTSGPLGIWTGSMNINVVSIGGVNTAYTLYVKGPKHLQKRVCVSTPTETTPGTYNCANYGIHLNLGANIIDMRGITQLAGDLPISPSTQNAQDGLIDSVDTAYIVDHFNDRTAAVLTAADVNLDGNIDTQDYSIVIAALGIKYDDPEAQ